MIWRANSPVGFSPISACRSPKATVGKAEDPVGKDPILGGRTSVETRQYRGQIATGHVPPGYLARAPGPPRTSSRSALSLALLISSALARYRTDGPKLNCPGRWKTSYSCERESSLTLVPRRVN